MIRNFYELVKNPSLVNYKSENDILKENDYQVKVLFLNDFLRFHSERIINTLTKNGADTKTIISFFKMLYFKDMMLLGDDDLVYSGNEIRKHLDWFSRLIYSDIYEDIKANELEKGPISTAHILTVEAFESDNYMFNFNTSEEMDILLNYYIYLVTDKDKRISNRKRLSKDDFRNIFAMNPLAVFDELGTRNKM